jgi:hypothetical protein
VYTPGFRGAETGVTNVAASLGSTLDLPTEAEAPASVDTAIPEKRGSTRSLNVIRISLGDALTAPPTGGLAFLSMACASALDE